MIAIVSATMIPKAYSYFSIEERYVQTIHTLNRLKEVGFNTVYLLDNSIDTIDLARIKNETFKDLIICQTPQYCFANKGLNEALLILNNLWRLPDNQPVFKISGRYYPSEGFSLNELLHKIEGHAILGVGSLHKPNPHFNTRSYVAKDKHCLESILTVAIEEMIAYGRDIHGISSLLNYIKSIITPTIGTPFQLSLEQSFARVLKHRKDYLLIDKIHIEGYIAGSDFLDFISE